MGSHLKMSKDALEKHEIYVNEELAVLHCEHLHSVKNCEHLSLLD